VVVKYADNVLKGFATSLSILLSSAVSSFYFHDISINTAFVTGAVIVLSSVYFYGYTPAPSPNAIAKTASGSTAAAATDAASAAKTLSTAASEKDGGASPAK
jgi:hypothetical protein